MMSGEVVLSGGEWDRREGVEGRGWEGAGLRWMAVVVESDWVSARDGWTSHTPWGPVVGVACGGRGLSVADVRHPSEWGVAWVEPPSVAMTSLSISSSAPGTWSAEGMCLAGG